MTSPAAHAVQLASGALGILAAQVFASELLALDWVKAITTLGLSSALVLFFVLTSWQREKRMSDRITKLENAREAKAVSAIEGRPCYAFANREDFKEWQDWWAEEKRKKRSRHGDSG
ncbi:MAG: hypothetical protein MUE50_03955 [Pirellulaceae bacterium]|jgi:hypothetical protein|nr:hypothetical protein [Pirellulaceae bacterium]